MKPYFLMAALYAALVILAALDSALAGLGIVPWFNGLRWLRVHFITLGVFTEIAFAILPALAANRAGKPAPRLRWDIWLMLNAGLVTLLIGIPLVNPVLILTGGTLSFIAAALLLKQLLEFKPSLPQSRAWKFYLSGVSFLLLGIFLGTGMWLGWGEWLHLAGIKEVHVHANVWGFSSLVFAGLLIDLYPAFARRALAYPRSLTPIFWMIALGALGLVIGPWLDIVAFSIVGLIIHLLATLWLLLNMLVPLRRAHEPWTPGVTHLFAAYLSLFIPVLSGPFIVLNVQGFPIASVEQNGPPALIYGWVLQFTFALVPYLFARVLTPNQPARLGGNWLSVIALNSGVVLFWLSVLLEPYQAFLQALAFTLFALAALPIVAELWRTLRSALAQLESANAASPLA